MDELGDGTKEDLNGTVGIGRWIALPIVRTNSRNGRVQDAELILVELQVLRRRNSKERTCKHRCKNQRGRGMLRLVAPTRFIDHGNNYLCSHTVVLYDVPAISKDPPVAGKQAHCVPPS